MDTPQPNTTTPKTENTANSSANRPTVLHRVCIQCNGVFQVPPEKYDAKQCPNCHKG